MTVRLDGLEVEAFRGFADERLIPLDADAIMLTGANGSGKTSFVDALCWVLTGSIPRLESEMRHRTDEVILNRYSLSNAARVVLHITVDGGRVSFARVGTSRANVLTALSGPDSKSGDEAEHNLSNLFGFGSPQILAQAVDRWVLRQDQLRAVLQASPNELHERLKDLLSLGVLDTFENQVKSIATMRTSTLKAAQAAASASDAHYRVSKARLEHLEARIQSSPDLAPALLALQLSVESARSWLALEDKAALSTPTSSTLASLRATYEEVRRWSEAIRATTAELGSVAPPSAESLVTDDSLRDLAAATERTRREVEATESALTVLTSEASERASLAAAALPWLGPTCPVCESVIDPDDVRHHLLEVLRHDSSEGLVSARQAAQAANAEQGLAEAALRSAQDAHQAQQATVRRRAELEARLDEQWAAMAATEHAGSVSIPAVRGRRIDDLARTLEALAAVGQAVRTVVTASQLSALSDERIQATTDLDAAQQDLGRTRNELEAASRQSVDAGRLLKASKEAVVDVLNRAMSSVNPNFSEVYRRLAPHPTFTDLSFEHDVYNAKGRAMPVVIDPLWEITENPAVVCSIGQLNVIALSYFLAFAMADSGDAMPFVVLDDPLQSLDDVNALGFADFCRQLKRDRQVVITTHDPRFSGLLQRKLAARVAVEQTIAIDMVSWDRRGPQVEVRRQEGPIDIGISA